MEPIDSERLLAALDRVTFNTGAIGERAEAWREYEEPIKELARKHGFSTFLYGVFAYGFREGTAATDEKLKKLTAAVRAFDEDSDPTGSEYQEQYRELKSIIFGLK